MDSEPESDTELCDVHSSPISALSQHYHDESSALVTARLTPENDLPGHHDYDFHQYGSEAIFEDNDPWTGSLDSDTDFYDSLNDSENNDPDYMADTYNYDAESDTENGSETAVSTPEPVVMDTTPDKDGVFWVERVVKKKKIMVRVKRCDLCEEEICLGDGHSLHAFHQHWNGSRCLETKRRKESLLDAAKKQRRISDMFGRPASQPSGSSHQTGTAISSAASSTPTDTTAVDFDSDYGEIDVPKATANVVTGSLQSTALSIITSSLIREGVCPGIQLDFPGSTFRKYPWQLHSLENMTYFIEHLGPSGELFVRSKNCHRMPRRQGHPCSECSSLNTSSEVERLRKRALGPLPISTNYRFYSFDHTVDLFTQKNAEKNDLKLKTLTQARKYQSITARLSDHEHFLNVLALKDTGGIGRLVKVAFQNKRSIREIVRRLELSIRGLYHVKSFTKDNYDLQQLVLTLGRPKLAYALAKALHLPSIRTTQSHSSAPRICASVGFPTFNEISDNLQALHNAHVFWEAGERPTKRGFSIMIDEIALDERPRYDSARDVIIGFARESENECDLSTVTVDTINAAADALHEKRISYAKEATVASLAAFGENNYSPAPILMSGTNKTENVVQHTKLLRLLINTYTKSPVGQELYGELFSLSSDGDATRRKAGHRICLSETLDQSHSLFRLVGNLPLMNLRCGMGTITFDIDYKHKFKNFATLLRGPDGILVANTHITPVYLKSKLSNVPGADKSRIDTLFNGKDAQNVPKAVTLLSLIHKLACDPAFAGNLENRAIVILGRFIGFLVEPYRDAHMSLSEQLKSLSSAAHLLFVLYRYNRTSFCPGQFYYDVQTLVKTAFWNVGKTKLLDPNGKFYILQCGTDRQEGDFGIMRLLEDNHNCDLLGLQQRGSKSAGIGRVFAEYPDWDRGHRRLNLEGKEGVDHTNPASWKGNVHVASISLFTAWVSGRRDVQDLLTSLKIDFDNFSSFSDDIDLLRPFGDYVGLRDDEADVPESLPVESRSLRLNIDAQAHEAMLDLDDLLPEPGAEDSDVDLVQKTHKHWLNFDGKMVHKSTAVRFLLYSEDGRKSYNREERAAGIKKIRTFSHEPTELSLKDDGSLIGDLFLLCQLAATFIRVENSVALAIMQVTGIQNKTEAVDCIEISALASRDVTIRGQVLMLSLSPSSLTTWIWNGSYETFPTSKSNKSPNVPLMVSKKSTLVEVPAYMTQAVKGHLEKVPNSASYTWHFSTSDLEALVEILWDQVKQHADTLPARVRTRTFPCRTADGSFTLVSESGTATMENAPKVGNVVCFLCGSEVVKARMRDHVGRHLVANMMGIREPLKQPIGQDPCGFCGRSGDADCLKLSIAKPAKTEIPVSECPYKVKFSIKSAQTPTSSGPSTNRPLQCHLCFEQRPRGRTHLGLDVYWSYNMPSHLENKHRGAAIPDDFEEKYAIGTDERIHLHLIKGTLTNLPKKQGMKRKANVDGNLGKGIKKARK